MTSCEPAPLPPIVELAPAKINLTLRVLGRRPGDGYHALESLVAFAGIGDRLTLEPAQDPAASQPAARRVDVAGPFAPLIDGTNLVTLALERAEAVAGRRLADRVLLEKTLPVAAGIGGGSADAAALLRTIRRAFPALGDAVDWQAIALSLGADVPVCLAGTTTWMTGVGEHLHPVALPRCAILLANPGLPMPTDKTGRVFAKLAAPPLPGSVTRPPPPDALTRADLIDLMRTTGNDLEVAALALFPAIAEVERAVEGSAGCEATVLSGAGPTIVGLFTSADAARAAERSLTSAHPHWWVRATTCGGTP